MQDKSKTLFLSLYKVIPLKFKLLVGYLLMFFKRYKFVEISPENSEDIYRLRYEIYLKEKYIEENTSKIFSDEFDSYSKTFLALDKNGKEMGSLRLVLFNEKGFPTEKYFNLQKGQFVKELTVEPSRLVVKDEFRKGNRLVMLGLGIMAYKFSKKNNVKYWLTTIPEKLAFSFLRDFNIKYEILKDDLPTKENLRSREEIGGYFSQKKLLPILFYI